MENQRQVNVPVLLKGLNYLLWSRTVKTALGGKGLWKHTQENAPTKKMAKDGEKVDTQADEEKWFQDDQMVLGILQSSLDPAILEAYSYCESSKDLWDTLYKVYGNLSNLSRVFEVKKAINELSQEDVEFTKHFGKFRALWAELEMLRPMSTDQATLNERREQDKVFGLLLTLNPTYNDLIKHILRGEKLPTLEEVCSQIQKEQGSLGLFGGKKELIMANQGSYKGDERRSNLFCDHCKKNGHTKEKCWILHPHLRPPRSNNHGFKPRFNGSRASYAHERKDMEIGGSSGNSQVTNGPHQAQGDKSLALVSYNHPTPSNVQNDFVRRSDLDALVKALKEASMSGNVLNSVNGESLHARNTTSPMILDSGASHHMISNPNLISNLEPAQGHVIIANGERIPINGIGSLRLFNKESKAFFMPTFTSNLVSIKRITNDLDCNVIFGPNAVSFQDIKSSKVFGTGETMDGLYVLGDNKLNSPLSSVFSSSFDNTSNVLWHARLGHPHVRALKLLLPKISLDNYDCEACILGKHCRSVFTKSTTNYDNCFDLIHSDVWTSPCESREHHKYFVTFIDEKSKYTWLTLLQSKDRVLEAFQNFQTYISNHFNSSIKIFRSDNGGEYTSIAFKNHLANHGILHQTSCPYTPQQNGVAERKNRHLMEVARSMMFHTNVPKKFWGDAVVTACYLINRTPTKILNDISPYEVLNKVSPPINHLRVFGCICFALVPGDQRNKLEARSTRAMFIGYSTTQKGYKCYVPETRKLITTRDVKFMENKGYYEEKNWDQLKDLSSSPSDRANNLKLLLEKLGLNMSSRETPEDSQPHQETQEAHEDTLVQDNNLHLDHEGGNQEEDHPDENAQEQENADEHDHDQGKEHVPTPPPILRRSTRVRHPPVYYNSQAVAHPIQEVCSLTTFPMTHQVFIGKLDQEQVPRSYGEAMAKKEWKEAILSELGAMETNQTWTVDDLPKGKKAVSSKWVFTIKYRSDGEIERHKARLVARGFTQTYGEDYLDTFAPVAKLHTVRVILALATNLDWELWQMDVKNAFLQGELEEEVYMYPPPGLEKISKGKVLKLRKAIYGLKQSPRAWYHKLSSTLKTRGFIKSENDHTLFTLQSKEGIVVILIYVDDIIISGDDKVGVKSTKDFLKSVFDIKDLGELKYFLGIEVCRSKAGLFLSQRKYTLDLLTETGKLGSKPAKTPLEDGYKVTREGELEDEPYEDQHQYRRMVGKLIYLTITRPDICFAVNQVSQHMQTPMQHHWKMIDRILRYLKGAPGQGIWMGRNQSTEIVGYCDADWAGDRVDRKSTTGYCTFIGGNLVTWKSKKQSIVSCSSAEAEYRAMRKLTNELVWLKGILKDLGIETKGPITMHCDNQAAIHIASNNVFHERTKHIEVDCHKVRQMVEQGVVLPCYTRSTEQLADIFTKAASLKVCEFIHSKLGLTSIME